MHMHMRMHMHMHMMACTVHMPCWRLIRIILELEVSVTSFFRGFGVRGVPCILRGDRFFESADDPFGRPLSSAEKMARPTASRAAEVPSDDACSDEDDNPMLACMPTPEALARLVKYADSLPGAAALIAAASQHVERTVLVV
jgi:hypothetical protein